MNLNQPLTVLPNLGPKRAPLFHHLGLFTLQDLLHHYPFRYDDLSQTVAIQALAPGQPVTLNGSLLSLKSVYTRIGKTIQTGLFSDGHDTLTVTWFNQPYLAKTLSPPVTLALSGKPASYRGRLTLVSPTFEIIRDPSFGISQPTLHTGRLVPIYPETAGLTSSMIRRYLYNLLALLPPQPDWLPATLLQSQHLMTFDQALHQIHFPDNPDLLNQALSRLKFDELLRFQLAAKLRKYRWQTANPGQPFAPHPDQIQAFIQSLPFTLTPSQLAAVADITQELTQPVAMNRLLQGEVGSGKTVIAAIAMYLSYLNQLPSVLMAPTEILARQHYQTIKTLLAPFKLTPALHTQAETIPSGPTAPIIGTQALLYRSLPPTLGLLIIDEQHRFGVNQRLQLIKRHPLPHVLSMTATPIPRTLALTLYAELDLSQLTDLPHQKPPVKTWLVPAAKRSAAYRWLKEQVTEQKAQGFVVCPLIGPSVSPLLDQVKAAETTFHELKTVIFPDLRLGLLHGRLKSQAKQAVLDSFRQGKLDLLVTTPVIEVGVDIPQATLILIEGAERFGLAQLHQLRGRVGRGQDPGYCLLFTSKSQATNRLEHLTQIHDGNRLAEIDLKLRGQGEIYGLKQSGHPDFKLATLEDLDLVHLTHTVALELWQDDPGLRRHSLILANLDSLLEKDNQAL